jgi:hypothetical protein
MKLEPHHLTNSWAKDLNRHFRPELMAELIEKRLTEPEKHGHYTYSGGKELPGDVLVAMAEDSHEFRDKLIPAIGILLYDTVHKDGKMNPRALRYLFDLIKDANFTHHAELVYAWLRKNVGMLDSKVSTENELYKAALFCFARIQPNDRTIESFWMKIWEEAGSHWWPAAFLGLIVQNPETACKNLPLLIQRNVANSRHMLSMMWTDLRCRFIFVDALRVGLRETRGWAGRAINEAYGALGEIDKRMLISSIGE